MPKPCFKKCNDLSLEWQGWQGLYTVKIKHKFDYPCAREAIYAFSHSTRKI